MSLGYCHKLNGQAQPGPGKPAALSDSLSVADWRLAVLTGASNAVMNGYFTPGLVAFYLALDEMKVKPPWVRYFVPAGAKLGKLAKEIRWVEEDLLEKGTSTQLLRTARGLP